MSCSSMPLDVICRAALLVLVKAQLELRLLTDVIPRVQKVWKSAIWIDEVNASASVVIGRKQRQASVSYSDAAVHKQRI